MNDHTIKHLWNHAFTVDEIAEETGCSEHHICDVVGLNDIFIRTFAATQFPRINPLVSAADAVNDPSAPQREPNND